MTITIVIPTYERPELLLECLNSCLAQTLPAAEILIGDDSISDRTEHIISKVTASKGTEIVYTRNSPPYGQPKNVNTLFQKAKGKKILLIHDDDILMPDALAVLSNCFAIEPSIQVAFGKQYIMTGEGVVSMRRTNAYNKDFYREKKYEGSDKLTPLESGMAQQFPNNAFLINADVAKRIPYGEVRNACDFDFGLRLGRAGVKMYYVDHFVAKYRIADNTVSTSENNDAALYAFKAVEQLEVPAPSLRIKEKWLRQRSGVAVGQAISNNEYGEAIRLFFHKYHRMQILTPGGLKRFFRLLLLRFRLTVPNLKS